MSSCQKNILLAQFFTKVISITMHMDVLGLFDDTLNVVVEYTYDSWGNILSITGSKAATVGKANPFRYRGYYYDEESGLYYLQSRYYDPTTGRFLNADKYVAGVTGNIQGYNLYSYGLNNPITMIDDCGDWPQWLSDIGDTIVNGAKKLAQAAKAFIDSFTLEVGIGAGFRAGAKANVNGAPVEISGGYKEDDINLQIGRGTWDYGKKTEYGASVNIGEVASFGINTSAFHTYKSHDCPIDTGVPSSVQEARQCPKTVYENVPSATLEIGFDAYFFVGGTFKLGWDYNYLKEELIRIYAE